MAETFASEPDAELSCARRTAPAATNMSDPWDRSSGEEEAEFEEEEEDDDEALALEERICSMLPSNCDCAVVVRLRAALVAMEAKI